MKTALYFYAHEQAGVGNFFKELIDLLDNEKNKRGDEFLMPISSSEILAPIGSIFEFFHNVNETEKDDGRRAVAFKVTKHVFRPQRNLLQLCVHLVDEEDGTCFHLGDDMSAPELEKYLQENWMDLDQANEWANKP